MGLDADVVAWLKKRGKGYQTRANNFSRRRMLDEGKRDKASAPGARNQIRKLPLAFLPIHLL